MSNKQIVLKIKPWMTFAAYALVSFFVSYMAASHIPDCPTCGKNDSSFIQVWTGALAIATLFATFIFTVIAFISKESEN